jgi:hypothetical protein
VRDPLVRAAERYSRLHAVCFALAGTSSGERRLVRVSRSRQFILSPFLTRRLFTRTTPAYEEDDGPLTSEQIAQIREVAKRTLPKGQPIGKKSLF